MDLSILLFIRFGTLINPVTIIITF